MTPRRTMLLVFAILALAAAVRFGGLTTRGLGHIEMYAPNLPLPEGISEPPPRPTLLKTLTGSMWEVHPPAWYLMNWPWTRVAGTSPLALRLPSAVFGVVSIWGVWLLARRERGQAVAALAALLLTVNGAHVMWSQIARPVMLASMLAIAASLLLMRVVSTPGRGWLASYLAVSALGLATEYYYWFVFGGQIAWVLLVTARERYKSAALLQWQFLVLTLASPFATLAVSQSRPSYLSDQVSLTILRYLGFGFLLGPAEGTPGLVNVWWASAVLLGLAFLALSVASGPEPGWRVSRTEPPTPSPAWFVAVIATAMIAIVGLSVALSANGMGTRGRLLATVVVPLLVVAVLRGLVRLLQRELRLPFGAVPLSTTLALVPPAAVFAVSLAVPFLDSKYFLLFTPFLDIVLAAGIVGGVRRLRGGMRWVAAAGLAAWLIAAHVASARFFNSVDATPIDYRGLAAQLRPALRDSDRILVFRHYAMTPLFYYVPAVPGRYVGGNYQAALRGTPGGRVWVVSLRDSLIPDPEDIRKAVATCRPSTTLRARLIRAELYEGCSGQSD